MRRHVPLGAPELAPSSPGARLLDAAPRGAPLWQLHLGGDPLRAPHDGAARVERRGVRRGAVGLEREEQQRVAAFGLHSQPLPRTLCKGGRVWQGLEGGLVQGPRPARTSSTAGTSRTRQPGSPAGACRRTARAASSIPPPPLKRCRPRTAEVRCLFGAGASRGVGEDRLAALLHITQVPGVGGWVGGWLAGWLARQGEGSGGMRMGVGGSGGRRSGGGAARHRAAARPRQCPHLRQALSLPRGPGHSQDDRRDALAAVLDVHVVEERVKVCRLRGRQNGAAARAGPAWSGERAAGAGPPTRAAASFRWLSRAAAPSRSCAASGARSMQCQRRFISAAPGAGPLTYSSPGLYRRMWKGSPFFDGI
jgi:hypothetical protein